MKAESGASVTAVALSPDKSTVAYALYHRRSEDRVSSSELFTIPASGGIPKLVVPRPQPGTIVDVPTWSPDGQSIYYAFQGVENRQPVGRIERVSLADGKVTPVYSDASYPAVSPGGQQLAFVHDDGRGTALRVGSPEGTAAKEIVNNSAFRGVAGPRFSPDGAWIAFVAQGPGPQGPAPAPPAAPASKPTSNLVPSLHDALASIFSVPVTSAHGDPWGVWKIRPDGSDLQRVGSLQEDEPLLAWSPDGGWIAVHGTGGLWIVDARGVLEPRRIADGTIGGIDW